MSRQSEYTLDLIVKGDEARDAIDQIGKSLDVVTKHANNLGSGINIVESLEQAGNAAKNAALMFNDAVMRSDGGGEDLFRAYTKGVEKAEKTLQLHAARIRHTLSEEGKLQREELSRLRQARFMTESKEEMKAILDKIKALNTQIVDLSDEELQRALLKTRQTRLTLRNTIQAVKYNQASAKIAMQEQKAGQGRIKTTAAWIKQLVTGKKQTDALLDRHVKVLKTLTETEKRQKGVTKAIMDSEKAQSRFFILGEKASRAVQSAYNMTGLAGGAGRMLKAGGRAIAGVTRDAMTAAENEVSKEKEARRIKGFYGEDAMEILNELYFQTGSDYSVIVDAINRVHTILKTKDRNSLIHAAGLEIRNPGMALAFASTHTDPSLQLFTAYGRRMEAIQRATGASEDQIQASTQKMANYRSDKLGNAKTTELQAVYLGLQNSGAFDSNEELDRAFDRFVASRVESKKTAWEDARDYDWSRHVSGDRNRIQAKNTIRHMDWEGVGNATGYLDTLPKMPTALESTSEQMRRIEYQKNQILVKLLPALQPLLSGLAKMLSSKSGEKAINGFIKFIEVGLPTLTKILIEIGNRLGLMTEQTEQEDHENGSTIERDGKEYVVVRHYTPPAFASGGVATMPSIVGERGPEAIIPLDYSRAQRAENISNNITQTFNMGNSQTTALSLAQAVRSRDFTRAMTDNQFFTRRCGAF